MGGFEGTGESRNSSNALLSAVAKRNIVEYWTAALPNGDVVPIKLIDAQKLGLKDGQLIKGSIVETTEQHRHADGTYARSYSVDRSFKVDVQNCC